MKRAGSIVTIAASLPFFWVAGTIAVAQTPEPLPSYADASSLREDASLHAVAFNSARMGMEIGVACGDRGTILVSEDGGKTWAARESQVDCRLEDVVWIDQKRVVIVGGGYDRITRLSRGVVLYSDDGGRRWRRARDGELPCLNSVRILADQSLVSQGDWSHAQLTRQFESHDRGLSWQGRGGPKSQASITQRSTVSELKKLAKVTGASAPIRDACRINSTALCAVGDHGVIHISTDNGIRWQSVRGKGRRSAILMVSNHPTSVAWPLLGNEALENRNRVSLLLRQQSRDASEVDLSLAIVHQVSVMLGGAGVDPIFATASPAREATDWIDIHHPATLMIDDSLPAHLHEVLVQAASASGARRIVVYSMRDFSAGGSGSVALHRDAFLPNTGVLASDLAADAMHYLMPARSAASSVSLKFIYDLASGSRTGASSVGGLQLDPGQVLASPSKRASRRQLQIAQARMKQSERIRNLILSNDAPGQFAQTLKATLDQSAKDDQFRMAWSTLQVTNSPGAATSDFAFREATLEELASRFPAKSAGRWAKLKRDTMQHSVEWKRLKSALSLGSLRTASSKKVEIVPVSPFQSPQSGVSQVTALSPLVVPKPETHDLNKPIANEKAEVDLSWEFHPAILISREAARRRTDSGGLELAGGESANLRRLADAKGNPWSALLQNQGPRVTLARRTSTAPRLDGLLEDACWQPALRSAGLSNHLRMAYDSDFVYIAITFPSETLRPDSKVVDRSARTRDNDLSRVDRVQICIDTDRDLLSAMQLQVSDARRTYDAIDGLPQWDPTWYVDVHRSDKNVSFEIAILRRDLADLPIPAGESWFVSARPLRADSTGDEPTLGEPTDWSRVIFQN